MKPLKLLLFPCMDKMQQAQERGDKALRELTRVCENDDREKITQVDVKKKFSMMAIS